MTTEEPPPKRVSFRRSTLVVAAGGAVVLLGTLLPWVDTPLYTTLGVTLPINFVSLPVGLIVAVLGIVLTVSAFGHESGTDRSFSVVLGVIVLAALGFTWLHLRDVTAAAVAVGLGGMGIGIWVSSLGAVIAIVGTRVD